MTPKKFSQTNNVFEGGIPNRDWCNNRGSLTLFHNFFFNGHAVQEEIQGCRVCEVADDPVVVKNVQPMKNQ